MRGLGVVSGGHRGVCVCRVALDQVLRCCVLMNVEADLEVELRR